MAVYDCKKKLLKEKEELIMKKLEKNGLVAGNIIILNQDYDCIENERVIRAENGTIGIIRRITIDGIDENENAKCTLTIHFYASGGYYFALNFSTTENNDNEITIEGDQINIKDLLTVLDESNEITQAVKQYEELENDFMNSRNRFYNSINLWKVLRVLWIGVTIFSCVVTELLMLRDITNIFYEILSVFVMVLIANVASVTITAITDIAYEKTKVGKKKEKEKEAALEIIEELDEKSCGERKSNER